MKYLIILGKQIDRDPNSPKANYRKWAADSEENSDVDQLLDRCTDVVPSL